YDGTTLSLSVNGNNVGTVVATGNVDTSSGDLRIGGNAIWGEYFAGLIDEIRIYSRALTAAEIQADMATPIGASAARMQVAAFMGQPQVLWLSSGSETDNWYVGTFAEVDRQTGGNPRDNRKLSLIA